MPSHTFSLGPIPFNNEDITHKFRELLEYIQIAEIEQFWYDFYTENPGMFSCFNPILSFALGSRVRFELTAPEDRELLKDVLLFFLTEFNKVL